MKKIIIKESAIDGKISKAENLILFMLDSNQKDELYFFGQSFKTVFPKLSNQQVENLADDLGYWEETGDYEVSLNKAKKKINFLAKKIMNFQHNILDYNYNLTLLFEDKSFDLNTRIKLFLYASVFRNNHRAFDKKMKTLTGRNYYEIIQLIEYIVRKTNKVDFKDIRNEVDSYLGNLIYYVNYYNLDNNFFNQYLRDLIVKYN